MAAHALPLPMTGFCLTASQEFRERSKAVGGVGVDDYVLHEMWKQISGRRGFLL